MSYQFLTTKPQRRLLHISHKEYIWLLITADRAGANSLYCKIDYTDGTSDTETIHSVGSDLEASQVKVLDVSYDVLAANADGGKTVKQLTISLAASNPTSEPDYIVYEPYTLASDEQRVFYYHNGQGGVDSLVTEGRYSNNQKLPYDLLKTQTAEGRSRLSVLSRPEQEVFTVYVGSQIPNGEARALRDMFSVRSAYERLPVSGGYVNVPIVIVSENTTAGSPIDPVVPMSFSYKYAVDEQSNKRINLSNGRVIV